MTIQNALVALYAHASDDSEHYFLCSGVFVAPTAILTVSHVFDNHLADSVHLRPLACSSPSWRIHGDVVRHPSLDAAVVRIESQPPQVTPLALDLTPTHASGPTYTANAYFEGRSSGDQRRTVTTFDDGARWYLTEPNHQEGMSGGALCLGGHLWAILVERYFEPSALRGCVVAVHQLWDGFLEAVPGVHVAAPPWARTSVAAATSLPRRVAAAPAAPDPLLVQARTVLQDLFSREPLATWAAERYAFSDKLPDSCRVALLAPENAGGAQLLRFLTDDLLPAMQDSHDERSLSIDAAASLRVRRQFERCLGLASKLCMDAVQRAAVESMEGMFAVPVFHSVAATLAVRNEPIAALEPVPGSPHHATRDRYALQLGPEHGEGDDQRFGIASMVASLKSIKNPSAAQTIIRSESELREWRGFLHNERDQKRGRLLVLGLEQQQALGPETIAWLDSFGVSVVQLAGSDSAFFWFDEDRLVGKVQWVVVQFATHPLWKDTNGSA